MSFRARPALRRPALAAAALCAAAVLAGCAGGRQAVGQALGIDTSAPNAFNVVPRAPLRLPPDLAALPSPSPGAPSPLDPQPQATARAALSLAGSPDRPEAAPSPGELSLLSAAGADLADPRIRATLREEEPDRESRYALSSFLGYAIPDGSEAEVLPARQEAERIRGDGGVTPTPPPAPPEPSRNSIVLPIGGSSD